MWVVVLNMATNLWSQRIPAIVAGIEGGLPDDGFTCRATSALGLTRLDLSIDAEAAWPD
jgi:hypothetical protein